MPELFIFYRRILNCNHYYYIHSTEINQPTVSIPPFYSNINIKSTINSFKILPASYVSKLKFVNVIAFKTRIPTYFQ